MLRSIILAALFLWSLGVLGQATGTIRGRVSDGSSGETLAGANVLYGRGLGTSTNLEGRFQLELPPGGYSLTI
ncbi:MAG: carboxypeptidase regulatory-like domain-containing protein [Bacteroides sp.]|jgi:hypothetical protein|nr:carboxypeptidase regulatory-like domain-containing protein [Bacteroides sp.]